MKRRDVLKSGLVTGLATAGLTQAQSSGFSMTIVHTNDTHARIEPVELTLSEKKVLVGGAARRIALYDKLRSSEKNLLLLHAGDVFQGTLYFTQYRGLADRFFMHRDGTRIMTLGNHEFDLGPQPLADFLADARFQVVSANVDVSKEAKLSKIKPYTFTRVGGETIGIVGLTTPDTPLIANPGPTVGFTDPAQAAQKAINELLARKVNKIVILSHLGYLADMELAKKIVGAQVIVGGHSHTLLGKFPHKELQPGGDYPTIVKNPEGKDVLVVQAWEWGKVVGVLKLDFDASGQLTGYKGEPILMTPEVARDDARAVEAQKVYSLPIQALIGQVVAQTKVQLDGDRNIVRKRESNLSNLIADSMVWKAKASGATIALQNGGGVRATIAAGPISVGKIYEVLPFGNTLVVLDLTGAELIAAMENSVAQWEAGGGRFLSGVAGIKYTFDLSKPVGQRVTKVEVAGKDGSYGPIDPAATYRAVVNSFIANGGDGFASLKDAKGARYDTGFADAESFLEYVRAQGAVEPKVEGRVTILNEPKANLWDRVAYLG